MTTKKIVFLGGLAVFFLPFFAHAAVTSIKIISAPQSIVLSATSSVFTIESQDPAATLSPVGTTTRVSLTSSSATGIFLTASASACNSATTSSITIANNTSHKSFCYVDSAPGSYTITISVPDQPAVSGDLQTLVVTDPSLPSSPTTTPTPSPTPSPTPPAGSSTVAQNQSSGGGAPVFTKSTDVKISEILPNPPGEDSGQEKAELENTGALAVNLDGWYLDDKTDSGIKASAYKLSGISISAGQFLSVVIPKGYFALNNSGGDALNLYYPDKTLADSINYSTAADENMSYQKIGGIWVWAPPTFGQANAQVQSAELSNATYKISITEFMPNPLGQDEGKEWVELQNGENFTVSLKGFILDDSGAGAPGSSAFTLSESMIIPAGGFLQIIIPEDKFSLSNSSKDSIRLFSPNKILMQEVGYKEAPEGQSYFIDSLGKWQWGMSTAGQANLQADLPPFNLVISELLPNPGNDQEEFAEIYNAATTTVNLENFVLQIGEKKKVFSSKDKILPQKYFIVGEDDLPARLRNSGQTVKLWDLLGREVSSLTYGAAKAGQSFGSDDGKNYIWTSSVTPEKANEYVLGESTSATAKKESSSDTKAATPEITKAQAKEILQADQDLKQQVAVLQESVNQLSSQLALASSPSAEVNTPKLEEIQPAQKPSPIGRMIVWPAAFAALGGAVYVTFRKLKK